MSGTPKVSTEKDGIFGRAQYIWDGSVFRKMLGTTAGYILSGLRPQTGYIPFVIDSVLLNAYSNTALAAGTYGTTVYTVPSNKIAVITGYSYFLTSISITTIQILYSLAGNYVVETTTPPTLNGWVSRVRNDYADTSTIIQVNLTNVTLNDDLFFTVNGYLIPKT